MILRERNREKQRNRDRKREKGERVRKEMAESKVE